MSAKFTVSFAGPLVSVQDDGRAGFMRFGVPRSGPMDRTSFAVLRRALEQNEGFAAIEVSIGGMVLKCTEGNVTAGFVGGNFSVSLDGQPQSPWSVFTIRAGSTLTIRPGLEGSWGYLGFCGKINSSDWLGSQATHLASGLCGHPLAAGATIEVSEAKVEAGFTCSLPIPDFARFSGNVRIVPGPQDDCFAPETLGALVSEPYEVTQDYDRMGMRLKGPSLTIAEELSMPSEALVRGAVQVPGHGDPIVLLADHQTTGGYPKIATVITADQDQLTQARARDKVRLVSVTPSEAVKLARAQHAKVTTYLESIAELRGTFEDRLRRSNLISGVVGDEF